VLGNASALSAGARLLALGLALSGCGGHPIPGDAHAFDPVERVPAVRAILDEGYRLEHFTATGVRPDGTIDVTDPQVEGQVIYFFSRPAPPPATSPPVGAGGSLDGRWTQRAMVVVERPGRQLVSNMGGETVYRLSRGLLVIESVPEAGDSAAVELGPSCPLAELFRVAIEQGAPDRNVVATIHYLSSDAASPYYYFEIADTPFKYIFGADCRLAQY
jgi:hypothetical protein